VPHSQQLLLARIWLITGACAGMVALLLGKPLDKTEQCSAWHERPLSERQLAYAACDAAVLLALLDHLLKHVAPSKYSVRIKNSPRGKWDQSEHETFMSGPEGAKSGEGRFLTVLCSFGMKIC
jgi:hypothetical protein